MCSFKQKFTVVAVLPLAILVAFIILNGVRFLIGVVFFGVRSFKPFFRTMAPSASIMLLLLFFLYLYVSTMMFSIFQCESPDPPDGKLYLQAVFEECGIPGGTQMTLMPAAILGICLIVVGYPLGVLFVVYRNRDVIMEDQVLRALNKEPSRGSDAYLLRQVMQRTYYQFKPQTCFWIALILTKRCMIALSALVFNRNPAFQMCICLLILFAAFGLQVRFRPYMPASEYASVLHYIHSNAEAETSELFIKLQAKVVKCLQDDKRKPRAVGMVRHKITPSQVGGAIVSFLLNYNTVESVLLIAGILVCLMALMYEVQQVEDVNYDKSRNNITAWLLVVLVSSVMYFATVFTVDILRQFASKNEGAGRNLRRTVAGESGAAKNEDDKSSKRRNSFLPAALAGSGSTATTPKQGRRPSEFSKLLPENASDSLSVSHNPLMMSALAQGKPPPSSVAPHASIAPPPTKVLSPPVPSSMSSKISMPPTSLNAMNNTAKPPGHTMPRTPRLPDPRALPVARSALGAYFKPAIQVTRGASIPKPSSAAAAGVI